MITAITGRKDWSIIKIHTLRKGVWLLPVLSLIVCFITLLITNDVEKSFRNYCITMAPFTTFALISYLHWERDEEKTFSARSAGIAGFIAIFMNLLSLGIARDLHSGYIKDIYGLYIFCFILLCIMSLRLSVRLKTSKFLTLSSFVAQLAIFIGILYIIVPYVK